MQLEPRTYGIELFFGKQLAGEMLEEVQEWAVKYGLSIEDATISCYKHMIWSLSEVNNNWQSHFDIMLSDIFKCLVSAPDITCGLKDLDGLKTPSLLFHSETAIDRRTGLKHFISNKTVDNFGLAFEQTFGLEYFGFERIQPEADLSASLIKNDCRSWPRNTIVYLINNKAHYYNGKKFLPLIADGQESAIH